MFEVTLVDRILPFDTDAARQFALIASYRRALGRPITVGDAQIAAIARPEERNWRREIPPISSIVVSTS
jgi:predicted nucleic acid-binding protein